MIIQSIQRLDEQNKLNKSIVLWGMGNQTKTVIEWLREHGHGDQILAIVDNFKCTFCLEYEGISVHEPIYMNTLDPDSYEVILAINYAADVRKQIAAYGVTDVYNLRNLEEDTQTYRYNIPYSFMDRKKDRKYLCYVLAGYESHLWESTLARIEAFQDERVDYCLVSSGKYDAQLDEIAARNGWSYLWTQENQVCYIQNLVIELHPQAQYMIKMDEDIFIGKDFFAHMIDGYHMLEREGEYRIGFVVPVVPLNCCGYVTYLKLIDKKAEYERIFGRAYKSRFSAVFNVVETAEYLWDTMTGFDEMAARFSDHQGYDILDCYYNIGCIMYSRSRWLMMGLWPETEGQSGMGEDEAYICQDNMNKDLAIYELYNCLAGHLAFGHQKQRMLEYYDQKHQKFMMD